ncbi:MAG: 2-C-methyl-D-erythritol 4-phosphate cytidylyltransferase [Betaproteobacteria bacterium]|jgi:2-C-methyl-D-erythritol 4-phosphate cytidylyltransferase
MNPIFALIAAAGQGLRMGGEMPKQYQLVNGEPLLRHAIRALCSYERVQCVFVVLAPQDECFSSLDWSDFGGRLQPLYCGGTSRAQSVFNGLVAMGDALQADDWVMVHDAARPCVNAQMLDRLCETLSEDPVGGLLAVPLADTLKLSTKTHHVEKTVSRERLWQAQTPQMFRYRLLWEAMRQGAKTQMTDESSAIEALGFSPRLIQGSIRNLKVTWPEDVLMAEMLLKQV